MSWMFVRRLPGKLLKTPWHSSGGLNNPMLTFELKCRQWIIVGFSPSMGVTRAYFIHTPTKWLLTTIYLQVMRRFSHEAKIHEARAVPGISGSNILDTWCGIVLCPSKTQLITVMVALWFVAKETALTWIYLKPRKKKVSLRFKASNFPASSLGVFNWYNTYYHYKINEFC